MLSWDDAKSLCKSRNSTLPIITDEDIDVVFQRFISEKEIRIKNYMYVWLDAHARRVDNSGPLHWINGHPSG